MHFAHPNWGRHNWIALDCGPGGARDLCLFDPERGKLIRLTATPGDEGVPSLSPDGRKISYSVREEGRWFLAVLDLETGLSQHLLELRGEVASSSSWSPDGSRIAFDMEAGKGENDLFTVSAQGDDLQILVEGPGSQRFAAWSPDGSWLSYHETRGGDTDIVVLRLADGSTNRPGATPDTEALPVWSPDSERLAFYSNRSGFTEVYSVARSGGEVLQHTASESYDLFATFSPDQRFLVFETTRFRSPLSFEEGADLMILELESGQLERLTEPSDFPSCVGPFPVR